VCHGSCLFILLVDAPLSVLLNHLRPMLGLVLVAIVLWSSVQAHAFLFTVGTPTQCDVLAISWTDGTPPFQLLVTPVFGVSRNLSIPQDAFQNTQGSFSFQVVFAAGQKFLLTMSDATGFGSGGSTGLLVVGSSQGGTCNVTSPAPAFDFELNSALQQCRPYTISGYSAAVQPVTFIGIVPGGTSVVLNLPLASGSFDWNADVVQGTSMIFLMVDAVGASGGSSDIKIVGASDDSGCLNNLSPSSTPAASTSSTISPSVSSSTSGPSTTSSATSNKGVSIAAVAGGVVGAVIFLASVITLGLFFLRKRRDTWGTGSSSFRQSRRTRSKVDLTYDPGFAQNTHPYASDLATPILSSRPFSDSNPYFDEPSHLQYPPRHLLPSQHSQSTPLSHQSHLLPNSDTNSFDPYPHSEAPQSTIVRPFVNPPTARESMSTVQRKAALAGTSAHTLPSRFIVHTDVEDVPTPNEIIELPPQYSDRRSPPPHRGQAMSSNSQLTEGSAALLPKP